MLILDEEKDASGTNVYGPFENPEKLVDGGAAFIKKDPNIKDVTGAFAVMESPVYRDTSPSCVIEVDYYYNAENTDPAPLMPMVKHANIEAFTTLDFMSPAGNNTWQRASMQIGRQRLYFNVTISLL